MDNPLYGVIVLPVLVAVISWVAGAIAPRFYNHRSRRSFKAQVFARLRTLDLIFAMKVTNDLTGHLIAQATMIVILATVGMASGVITIAMIAIKPDVSWVYLLLLCTIFSFSLYKVSGQFQKLIYFSGAAFNANTEVEAVRTFYKSSSLYQFLDADDRTEIDKLFEQVGAFAKVLDGERRAALLSKWDSTLEEDINAALAQVRKEQAELLDAIKQLAQAAPAETP
ncbi:hypothetical protein [Rhizobium leguminosarum]|uniref:hypothetical protein n=1 Tax=Rhizobium leguminosarum TaxID=384 RepID=UPI003F9A36AE